MAKKEDIVADLKNLLETDTTRTKMGRIWEVYDEIVELQQGGVSMKNIEARLNERGFALKPGNLTSYLCQIRKKKGIEKTVAAKKEPKQPNTSAAPVGLDKGKPVGVAATPKKPAVITSDDVKNSFAEKKDFSRYDD